MANPRSSAAAGVLVQDGGPLIGIFVDEDGREAVRYFSSEEAADQAIPSGATEEALALAGAWRDLDWDTLARELDRIRHESPPSPPISP